MLNLSVMALPQRFVVGDKTAACLLLMASCLVFICVADTACRRYEVKSLAQVLVALKLAARWLLRSVIATAIKFVITRVWDLFRD